MARFYVFASPILQLSLQKTQRLYDSISQISRNQSPNLHMSFDNFLSISPTKHFHQRLAEPHWCVFNNFVMSVFGKYNMSSTTHLQYSCAWFCFTKLSQELLQCLCRDRLASLNTAGIPLPHSHGVAKAQGHRLSNYQRLYFLGLGCTRLGRVNGCAHPENCICEVLMHL